MIGRTRLPGCSRLFCLVCLVARCRARADESTETAVAAETCARGQYWRGCRERGRASAAAAQPPDASPIDLAILLDQHMVIVRLRVRRGESPFLPFVATVRRGPVRPRPTKTTTACSTPKNSNR